MLDPQVLGDVERAEVLKELTTELHTILTAVGGGGGGREGAREASRLTEVLSIARLHVQFSTRLKLW